MFVSAAEQAAKELPGALLQRVKLTATLCPVPILKLHTLYLHSPMRPNGVALIYTFTVQFW